MSFLSDAVVEAVGWALVHSVWELTLVALLVWGILCAVPRGLARWRYGMGLVGMGVMVVCLVGTVWGYRPEGTRVVGGVRAGSGGQAGVERLLILDHPTTLGMPEAMGHVATVAGGRGATGPGVMGWVVWGYLAGVAVCCLRLVGMWAGMAGVKRGAADAALQEWARELAVRMGIGVVRVVESARVEVPVVVGILRPVVVVPMMAVTGLSEGELRALLAHEMAHIRRWDPVVNAVQCVVEAMLFYHPAVWWISRVIREERECCCDDVAAAVVGDRATYAGALAAMEGLRGVRGRLAIGARTGGLAGRVERLLGRRRELQGGRGWAVVTCMLAALAVGMGAWVAGCAGGANGEAAERVVGNGEVVEKVYDVSDMLVPTGEAKLVMPGAGREDGVWKGTFAAAAGDATMAEIKNTVETIVAPDTWKEKEGSRSGSVGAIELRANGLMAVTQTGAEQKAVKTLLDQLRQTRAVRIGVESELLVVSKEAYEALGADKFSLKLPGSGLGGGPGVEGTIVDRYQWDAFEKLAGAHAAAGRTTAEVLNGQAVGMRLGGKVVPGGLRMAVQSTASADRRYVVWALRMVTGNGEEDPKARTMVSVPNESATLCWFLGKVEGQEKYLVWAMRAGIAAGGEKVTWKWGFAQEGRWEASDGTAVARGQAKVNADVLAAKEREQVANARVREVLETQIDVVANEQTTLEETLKRVQNAVRVNLLVNWTALESAGVARTTPTPVNLKRVAAEKALKEILNEAGGAKVALGYQINDGVVTVSTREDLESAKYQTIQVYDLRDFLGTAWMPQTAPALPDGDAGWKKLTKEEVAARQKEILKEIEDTVETIVAPTSWQEKGGKVGSIRELSGYLIVNQTEENQQALKNLLGQLRESHRLQTSVEATAFAITEGRFAALAKGYAGLKEGKAVTVGGEESLKGFLAEVEGDGETLASTMPRVTVFNGYGVGMEGEAKQRGRAAGVKGFALSAKATVTADRKGVVIDVKCGVPEVLGETGGKFVEKDVQLMVADRTTVAMDGGVVKDKQGEARRVVWLVRPMVIVQQEIEEGAK